MWSKLKIEELALNMLRNKFTIVYILFKYMYFQTHLTLNYSFNTYYVSVFSQVSIKNNIEFGSGVYNLCYL